MSQSANILDRAFDADAIIVRLKERLGIKSDKEFASKIGVSQSTLSSWRNRQSIPLTYIIAFARLLNVSTDWIFFGEPISVTIPASQADEAVMRLSFLAALTSKFDDDETRIEITEKAMMYYSILRTALSSLRKMDGLSEDQTSKIIEEMAAKLA